MDRKIERQAKRLDKAIKKQKQFVLKRKAKKDIKTARIKLAICLILAFLIMVYCKGGL